MPAHSEGTTEVQKGTTNFPSQNNSKKKTKQRNDRGSEEREEGV